MNANSWKRPAMSMLVVVAGLLGVGATAQRVMAAGPLSAAQGEISAATAVMDCRNLWCWTCIFGKWMWVMSSPGSVIDNTTFNHIHYADDYRDDSPGGCQTCGGASTGGSSELPMFHLQRFHRYRDTVGASSFGPGVYSNYDFRLNWYNAGNYRVVDFVDPVMTGAVNRFIDGPCPLATTTNDPLDGRYISMRNNSMKDAVLYRYVNDQWTQVSAPQAGDRVDLKDWDGRLFRFEMINLSGATANLSQNLELHLAMDEGTGTTVADSSGNSRNGTASNYAGVSGDAIIVEDTQATQFGTWYPTTEYAGYLGTRYLHNNGVRDANTYLEYNPQLTATQDVDVFINYTSRANNASNLSVLIHKADGTDATVTVDERTGGGQWVWLGRYSLNAGSYARILTLNANGLVVADAMKFVVPNTTPANPQWTVGHDGSGGAMQFDGADSKITLDNYMGIGSDGARTVAAWVKVPAGGRGAIVSWGGASQDQAFSLVVQNGQGPWRMGVLRCETNLGFTAGTRRIDDGAWHHVAVAFSPEAFTSGGGGPANGWNHQVRIYIDGQLDQVTETASAPVNTAQSLPVTIGNDWRGRCLDGAVDEVRIYSRALAEEEIATLAGQTQVLAGRLTRIEDRNGYGLDIAYKTWTPPELAESPSRQWQIDTVTDAYGRVATFHYNAQQLAGRWSVSSVDLPNGQAVSYSYTDGFLSAVNHPDGSQSTFTRTFNTNALCTVMAYDDVAADPAHRKKNVYLSPQVTQEVDNGQVVPMSANLCRMVVNGAGEVTYLNIPNPAYTMYYVYEGGSKLKKFTEWTDRWELQYADSWTVPANGAIGYGNVGFTGESTFTRLQMQVNTPSAYRLEPTYTLNEQGYRTNFPQYNEASKPLVATNQVDGTSEKYQYNAFQQPTRYEDRLGRVTRYTYDANGNMLTKEVGLLMVNGVETQQPEHAVYQWEYYPQGNANQYLLSAAIDANGHRTEYVYNTNHQLTQILEPDDTGTGNHVAHLTEYETTAARRPVATQDALGRRTEYTYDARSRITRTFYVQNNSDEKTYFGAPGSGFENLVVAVKDRDDHYAQIRYDASDRMTLKITGLTTEADALNPSYTPDPSALGIESRTYIPGTKLADTVTSAGNKTEYAYDYRQRPVATTVYPRTGKTLSTSRTYVNNELFKTTDSYGYGTFFAYRDADGQLVRNVRGLTPAFSLADEAAVVAQQRDLNPNAQFLITDTTRDAEGQVIQTTDPRNVTATYSYDSRGRLVTHIAAASGGAVAARTETSYDANSNITEVRTPRYFSANDTNGYQKARTTMTYTQRNLLTTRTVAPGTAETAAESFTYNADRTINIHTDFRSNQWQTLWRSCCQRIKAQVDTAADVDGSGTNKRGAAITLQDHVGNQTYLARVNDVDAVTNFRDPPADVTLSEVTTRFDSRNRPIARTVWLVPLPGVDENNPPIAGDVGYPATDGLTTHWLYDDDLTDGVGLDDSMPAAGEVSISRLLTELAADGITFTAGNQAGSAAVQVSPEGELSVAVADGLGRPIITGVIAPVNDPTDPLKPLTWSTTLHDTIVTLSGRFSDGLGGTTNGDALETTTIDVLNYTMKGHTDGAGRAIEAVDAESNVSYFTYDAQGNRIRSRGPNSIGVDNVYDERGRVTQAADTQEQAESTNRQFAYDAESNTLTTTDAKGLTQTSTYDARNRRIQHTDRNTGITTFAYDENSNLLTITDADANSGGTGKQTIYTYDPRNLKLTEALPDHVPGSNIGDPGYDMVLYAYDGELRTRSRTDQQGDVITWTYDLANRMVSKIYHPYQQLVTYTDMFTYDTDSRMLTAASGLYNNTLAFAYTPTKQMASESLTVDFGTPQTYTIQRNYDSRKLLTQITYPDASTVARTYTARRQLQQVDYNTAALAQFQYDPSLRETQRTMGNNIVTMSSYNRADNMVTDVSTPVDGALSFSYTYDANKNPTSETTGGVMSNYSWTTPTANNSGFDNEDRLINWQRSLGFSQQWDLSLVGDWNANTINGSAETRAHNPVHEILTVTPGNPQTTLLHDAKGNLSRDERNQTYTWDFNNNLSQAVNTAGETWTYTYDALGRRVSKSVTTTTKIGTIGSIGTSTGTTTATTTTTVYVCLSRMVQSKPCGQEIAEYNANAAPTSPLRMYVFGTYIDDPLAVITPQGTGYTTHYYHQNRQYCATALTDNTGAVVERYAYTAYGQTTILAPDGITPRAVSNYGNAYLYTGRRFDGETSNYYFRARYHSPTLGRFLGRDSVGYVDGWSLYAAFFAMRGGLDALGLNTPTGNYTTNTSGSVTTSTLSISVASAFLGDSFPSAATVNFTSIGTTNQVTGVTTPSSTALNADLTLGGNSSINFGVTNNSTQGTWSTTEGAKITGKTANLNLNAAQVFTDGGGNIVSSSLEGGGSLSLEGAKASASGGVTWNSLGDLSKVSGSLKLESENVTYGSDGYTISLDGSGEFAPQGESYSLTGNAKYNGDGYTASLGGSGQWTPQGENLSMTSSLLVNVFNSMDTSVSAGGTFGMSESDFGTKSTGNGFDYFAGVKIQVDAKNGWGLTTTFEYNEQEGPKASFSVGCK